VADERVVEVLARWRPGNPDAETLPLSAAGCGNCSSFTGGVSIGEDDDLAYRRGQIKGSKAGGGKSRPGRVAGRNHRGETCLDAFADHEKLLRGSKPNRPTAAGTEHHLHGLDRRLAAAVPGEERPMHR
jgi:hypothetical protein